MPHRHQPQAAQWRRTGGRELTPLLAAPLWPPSETGSCAFLDFPDLFGGERSRPYVDLTARVRADHPRTVVDLGCGPGNLTTTLAERWPAAGVVGLDSSPEMIVKTAALNTRAEFSTADVRDWTPSADSAAYPIRAGRVHFPFRRIFLVARIGAGR